MNFLAPLVAFPASAADGVIEINQACATITGCSPSDKPGFPVTITSGSYILTSDLVVPAEVHGISTEAIRNTSLDNANYGISGNPGAVMANNLTRGNDIGLRCTGCMARDNAIDADTTGIEFSDSYTAIYGGNIIRGETQALLNAALGAVQDGVNVCNGSPCP